jgi:hypothetical protein
VYTEEIPTEKNTSKIIIKHRKMTSVLYMKLTLKCFLEKYEDGVVWTEFIWLRIETRGELL